MLVQNWSTVYDAGLTINQHWGQSVVFIKLTQNLYLVISPRLALRLRQLDERRAPRGADARLRTRPGITLILPPFYHLVRWVGL